MTVSREEIEAVAQRAADKAVGKLMLTMGIDTNDPIEQQKDAAFLRSLRIGTQGAGWKAVGALIVLVVGGWATATVLGLKAMFSHQ